jgi:hypothetical protein
MSKYAGLIRIKVDQASVDELAKKGHHFANQNGIILASHGRCISQDRLIGRVGFLDDNDIIRKVEEGIKDAFGIGACDDCGYPLRPNGLICFNCHKVLRRKCMNCYHVSTIDCNYCPKCGRGLNYGSPKL